MQIYDNMFYPEGSSLSESDIKQVIDYVLQTKESVTQSELQQLFITNYKATIQDLIASKTRPSEVMYEQKIRNVRCHIKNKAINKNRPHNSLYLYGEEEGIFVDITGTEPIYYKDIKVIEQQQKLKRQKQFATFQEGVRAYISKDKTLVGILGELYTMNYLQNIYNPILVKHVSREEGNGCGYDIEINVLPKCLVEVKTTTGDLSKIINFSTHEYNILSTARERNELAYIYRVFNLMYDDSKVHLLKDFNEDNTVDLFPLITTIYAQLNIYHWDDIVDYIKPSQYSLTL